MQSMEIFFVMKKVETLQFKDFPANSIRVAGINVLNLFRCFYWSVVQFLKTQNVLGTNCASFKIIRPMEKAARKTVKLMQLATHYLTLIDN